MRQVHIIYYSDSVLKHTADSQLLKTLLRISVEVNRSFENKHFFLYFSENKQMGQMGLLVTNLVNKNLHGMEIV